MAHNTVKCSDDGSILTSFITAASWWAP